MRRIQSHLSKLAELPLLMKEGEHIRQFGAICRRISEDGSPEVLLITTRETRRWSIPKGWAIKGLKSHETAAREAWEEAGVVGRAKRKPLGYFSYVKVLKSGRKVASIVQVHVVDVAGMDGDFPEKGQRDLEWLPPFEAAARVLEPELKHLLTSLHGDARIPNASWGSKTPH